MPEPASNVTPFDPAVANAPALQKGGQGKKKGEVDPLSDINRAMPFSDDAEKGVLSCFLQNPTDLINDALTTLAVEAFYHPANRLIYEVLREFNNDGRPIDLVSLSHYLIDKGIIDKIGGPATLADLYSFVPTPAHYEYYKGILHDKHLLRRIITACTESIQNAYEYQEDVPLLLDRVEQRMLSVREDTESRDTIKPLRQHIMEAVDTIEHLLLNPGQMNGLSTGYRKLDLLSTGLQGGELFVIAARPSMGKTSFCMNIVEYVAVELQRPVAFFSLEMSASVLVQRLIAGRAGVNMSKLKSGLLNREQMRAVTTACGQLQKSEIFIDETPGLDIMEFRAKARRLKKQHNIGLITIDYLQLMTSGSKRAKENRQIEIAEISAGLKGVAKELDIPIIVLAQLNRAVEQRKGGRPMLSDLRESGSIEQDADMVGLLTRDDYAGSKTEVGTEEEEEAKKGKAVLIMAKNRNGPTDDVPLKFIAEYMKFLEREPDPDEGQ
ncbi:replicative DNA helicase [Verrucomicrobium sp. BvORR034]|uniref:replicative DNA helicase n=1 Tax=Verrucomicrobium sp. BvORR034 TaxID=1396418 RepID=UPI0009E05DE2|nr:replicative DNA helicase [Verrucomicrobium sp. BvORR034]